MGPGIIAAMWSREAIAVRVDALRAEHSGEELVEAVRLFAEQLGDDERVVLGEVLLERAAEQRPSLAGVRRPSWFDRARRRRG